MKKALRIIICFLLMLCLIGCSNPKLSAVNLMDGITAQNINASTPSGDFYSSQMELYTKLFKATAKTDENTLISPLSIELALALAAGGANGETLNQMQTLLGGDIDTLNANLKQYVNAITKNDGVLSIANSIWYRNDSSFVPNSDFLQLNANYYGADAYTANFDDSTVKDINNWVDKNTQGMIKKLVDKRDMSAVMFLINAVAFDAEWQEKFTSTKNGYFYGKDGSSKQVDMLTSDESLFFEYGGAQGFIKNYEDGRFSFAALLPDSNDTSENLISNINASKLLSALKNASVAQVKVQIPSFKCDFTTELPDVLSNLGMPLAFDAANADFSRMGKSIENLYIDRVVHKTHITFDAEGTKAAAVTGIGVKSTSLPIDDTINLVFDRPFIYFIIDNQTALPIFMGCVNNITEQP